jgi:hypothetical protein
MGDEQCTVPILTGKTQCGNLGVMDKLLLSDFSKLGKTSLVHGLTSLEKPYKISNTSITFPDRHSTLFHSGSCNL